MFVKGTALIVSFALTGCSKSSQTSKSPGSDNWPGNATHAREVTTTNHLEFENSPPEFIRNGTNMVQEDLNMVGGYQKIQQAPGEIPVDATSSNRNIVRHDPKQQASADQYGNNTDRRTTDEILLVE